MGLSKAPRDYLIKKNRSRTWTLILQVDPLHVELAPALAIKPRQLTGTLPRT